MRITKKSQTKLLLSCLISTISITGVQAVPSLAPVAEVNLSEAPPPWAARSDIQNTDESIPNETATAPSSTIDADFNTEKSFPTLPVLGTPEETPPLTLEGHQENYQQPAIENMERINTQQARLLESDVEEVKKTSLMGKLFSRKKNKEATEEQSNPNNIENWYRDRSNYSQTNTSSSNLEAQASQGDTDAQYKLGLMYRSGSGVEENIYQAIHWLTRAANADHSQSQYALAMIFRENASQAQDEQKAVSWYKRAAENGHADAQYSLGLLYANGDNVPQDNLLAKQWFKRSAEQGNMAAKIAFATSFTNSKVQDQHVETYNEPIIETPANMATEMPLEIPISSAATKLNTPPQTRFSTAENRTAVNETVTKEEPQEQIRVASITAPTPQKRKIENDIEDEAETQVRGIETRTTPSVSPSGISSNVNPKANSNVDIDANAVRNAAMSGDAKSQLLYGSMYEDGKGGIAQNYKEAAYWYKKSADQGYAQAQYNLGLLYEDGKGIDQDYYEASQWYKRASNNGFSEAQNNLGVLYILGKGVIKDRNRAELMFRRALEQGNPNAERNLEMLLKSTPN